MVDGEKKFEILDVADEHHFRTHIDILDGCFGQHGNLQSAGQEINEIYNVWMPKFLKHKNGKSKKANKHWTNEIDDSGDVIITTTDEENPKIKHYSLNHRTLVFGKTGYQKFYTFRGVYVEDQEKGTDRKVVFRRVAKKVRLIGETVKEIELLLEEPLDDFHTQEEKEIHAAQMDLASLEAAIKKRASTKSKKREVTTTQYVRDAYVAEGAKRRADGICQLCGNDAPFKDADGKPFLEVHHIIWLSEGGADSPENTVALCPNCHRKMHNLKNPDEVSFLLSIAKGRKDGTSNASGE